MKNPRLVVVSNRIPGDQPPAGGLVFALDECLRKQGGLWVGNSGTPVDEGSEHLAPHDGYPYQRMTFDTTQTEHEQFYLGYANSVLWPLCHRRTDLMEIARQHFQGYQKVNSRLARQLSAVIRPDDLIWIHDYHFLPLAHELRQLGCANRIGFFLHVPFPAVNDLRALTEVNDLIDWLSSYDLFGLQAERDVAECISTVRAFGRGELLPTGRMKIGTRETDIRAFPIGIDAKGFQKVAVENKTSAALDLPKDECLVIGVDRLDYSKGIVNRFQAFAEFLERRTPDQLRCTMLQIAPGSRGEVAAYQDIRDALERMAGSVNGRHSELDWTPIRYISRSYDREVVAALYRRADVALVTPLIDGMNLVAKEFIAAQDPSDPGVLILSNLAGAAEQLDNALLVNPFDADEVADAIERAVTMPLDERKDRHAALAENVFERDVFWWTNTFLRVLSQPSPAPHLVTGDSTAFDRLFAASA